jgi:hypothetical protein
MLGPVMVASFLLAGGLAGSLAAQDGGMPALESWLPLRADEVIDDAAKDLVIVRGNMELPGGKIEKSVVIVCSRNGHYAAFTNFATRTDDRFRVDAPVCDAVARVPGRAEQR